MGVRLQVKSLSVLNCSTWKPQGMTEDAFFAAYRHPFPPTMLKLKDYPTDSTFKESLPELNQVGWLYPVCVRAC
jgi:hypothetical protein